ncbi:serine/threonine protein kinase [Naegleria gruberi]|uniref:Serine/threonine protein kinase n=1 Tax=Naegleria gruberi TaxID=5762 RepID=D2VCE7_NAEGR|nr:serine/threonine protein kinase [Naegleria gruberi]EFC45409.1 serine/threonine protein kinase [Naegleria gruberi]|eukprot:XP_002678153.1 serine/threonine protein kinase [Naegleria gruberi strain NEG-M]
MDNNCRAVFFGQRSAVLLLVLLLSCVAIVVVEVVGGAETKFARYTVSNFAGYSDEFGNGGEAIDATLAYPYDMFFSSQKNSLYFTDHYRRAVRKVSLTDGKISIFQNDNGNYEYKGIAGNDYFIYYTFGNGVYATNIDFLSPSIFVAGSDTAGFSGDNSLAKSALLNNPTGLFYSAFDECLYVCDSGNHVIRKIDTNTNVITTIAGNVNTNNTFYGDGILALNASFSYPQGIYVSQSSGEIFVSDSGNNRIRKILTNGTIVTLVGTVNIGFDSDSSGLSTTLNNPTKLWMNKLETELYIADTGNNRIRKYDTLSGMVTTIAGGGTSDNISIQATQAQLYEPRSIMRNPFTEEWYILESRADRISLLSQTGTISRFCGSPFEPSFNSDPFSIRLTKTYGVTKVQNVLYLTQSLTHSILQIKNSQVYSFGKGEAGFAGDGLVLDSNTQFNNPTAVAFSSGTKAIYIADTYNHRIRRIDPITNIITTIAGTGSPGYNGDNILATSAKLNNPLGVSVWYDNQTMTDIVYIADTFNNKMRRINSNGFIETLIGVGNRPGKNNQQLWHPHSVSVSFDGRVFTADSENKRIMLTLADNSTSTYLTLTNKITAVATFNNYLLVTFGTNVFQYDTTKDLSDNLINSANDFANPQAIGYSDNGTDIFVANTFEYEINTFKAGDSAFSALRNVGNYIVNQDKTLATKMKVDTFGNTMYFWNSELYFTVFNIIYKIKTDGKIERVIGSYSIATENPDSYERIALIPSDFVIKNGIIYSSSFQSIRMIDPSNKSISIFAGSSSSSNFAENIPALNTTMNCYRIAVDNEYLYYFDLATAKIRKISFSTRMVTTVAGGSQSVSKTSPSVPLDSPVFANAMTVSPLDKRIYFLDDTSYYLKTITSTSINYLGTVKKTGLAIASDGTIFVGGSLGVSRFQTGGTFTNITLPFLSADPSRIIYGENGELYVSERRNIYKLTPYCDSGYSLNITTCTPICYGAVGSSSCGGPLQGSCIAPDTCQCSSTWSGSQCLISTPVTLNSTSTSGGRVDSNNGQIVLIAVLVPVLVVLFITILIVVIVAFVIAYMKLKKQGSTVTNSVVKSRQNFEMKDANASTFDQISDFPTDDSFFRPLSSSMSSVTNSEATFDPLSRYKELTKIGQGAFGSVFKAFDTKTNKTKALKIIKFKSFGELNAIMKEGMQLMNISHPNILKVNDLFVDKQEILCMDMEFYEKGDLSAFIKPETPFCGEVIVKQIVYQMCSALDFVHSNLKAIHRDVKLSNIFIKSIDDTSIHTILADFGLAKDNHASAMQSYAGTPLYMSPELGLGASYNSNTDIWSLGVTIYQLMTKDNTTAISHMYLSKDEKQVCEILHDKMKQTSNYSEELISICLKMLTKDSSSRPSAKDILKDPYFSK